jgi:hypothetical protein
MHDDSKCWIKFIPVFFFVVSFFDLFQFIIESVFQFSHKKHKHKFHNIDAMNMKST